MTEFSVNDLVEIKRGHPSALKGVEGAKARLRAILPGQLSAFPSMLLVRVKIRSSKFAGMELTLWAELSLIARAHEVCDCGYLSFPHRRASKGCEHFNTEA